MFTAAAWVQSGLISFLQTSQLGYLEASCSRDATFQTQDSSFNSYSQPVARTWVYPECTLFIFSVFIYQAGLGLSCGTCAQSPSSTWDLSAPTRDGTHVHGFARWFLNHWITREFLPPVYFKMIVCQPRINCHDAIWENFKMLLPSYLKSKISRKTEKHG